VRLEKRLAALLHDLAAHKRMSLSSLLEEILLHTNEPLGDGVASPHTKSQLRYIQELKKKHGIDYDSHGSYRFVEVLPGRTGEARTTRGHGEPFSVTSSIRENPSGRDQLVGQAGVGAQSHSGPPAHDVWHDGHPDGRQSQSGPPAQEVSQVPQGSQLPRQVS